MTTANEIITQAFRENNITAIGDEPTDAEVTEALPRLNNFISGLFGNTLAVFLSDWTVPPKRRAPVAARYPQLPYDTSLPSDVWPYPPGNVRLLVGLTEAKTVYLPFNPNDGARVKVIDVGSTADITLDANGRLIDSAVSITDAPLDITGVEWFYRADTANWTRIAALGLDDDSPFPPEFDDLLVTGLAIRIAPRFGKAVQAGTIETFNSMMKLLKRRYYQPVQEPASDLSSKMLGGSGFDETLL